MKKMAPVPDIKSDDGDVFEFWLTATAEAAMIQEIRTTILKDASKKANFPGFRKVTNHLASLHVAKPDIDSIFPCRDSHFSNHSFRA